jgi:hypothetical protein
MLTSTTRELNDEEEVVDRVTGESVVTNEAKVLLNTSFELEKKIEEEQFFLHLLFPFCSFSCVL